MEKLQGFKTYEQLKTEILNYDIGLSRPDQAKIRRLSDVFKNIGPKLRRIPALADEMRLYDDREGWAGS